MDGGAAVVSAFRKVPVGDSITSSEALVDLSRVAMIERGEWDNAKQDWRSILTLDTGHRILTRLWYGEAQQFMEPTP